MTRKPAARRDQLSLTRSTILDTAMRIGDQESLDALTMRRLASELGVGTMTLYGYFHNKDELLDAMADDVLGSIQFADEDGMPAADVVRSLAVAFLEAFRAHPSVVRVLTSRTTTSQPAMIGAYEHALALLVDAGFSAVDAVRVYGAVLTYGLGFAAYAFPRPWGGDIHGDPTVARLRARRSRFYESLPPDDFPVMVRLHDELVSLPTDEQFYWGLDALLAGILAKADPPVAGSCDDGFPRPPGTIPQEFMSP